MIWIWIAAAVLISWTLCRKQVSWYHYIWMLLPIEMYGVTIAGATVKPYMLFGLAIIIHSIMKKRGAKIPETICIIIFLLFLSDIINGFIVASIMQHIMFVFIIIIACSYVSSQDGVVDFDEISAVTIATTIGYGVVFVVAYTLVSLDINLPDIYTADRYSTGIVVRSIITGYGNAVTIRLRGFCIDPNSVVSTLVPGATFGLANILFGKENKVKSLMAVLLFFLVVIYSGSRMALLSSLIMISIMFVIGYRQTANKTKWIKIAFPLIMIAGVFITVNHNKIIAEIAYDIDFFFSSRASLTDDAGRLTIWKNNFRYLVDNNRLFVGVGQNQISNYTVQGKACHNTWLEWICGTGLPIGIVMDLYFITAPITFSRKAKQTELIYEQDILPIILAYIIVLISITTVDNITNSVMLILSILFKYGTPYRGALDLMEE